MRNHIIDVLVSRSKSFVQENRGAYDPRNIAVVRPGAAPVVAAETNVLRLGAAGH